MPSQVCLTMPVVPLCPSLWFGERVFIEYSQIQPLTSQTIRIVGSLHATSPPFGNIIFNSANRTSAPRNFRSQFYAKVRHPHPVRFSGTHWKRSTMLDPPLKSNFKAFPYPQLSFCRIYDQLTNNAETSCTGGMNILLLAPSYWKLRYQFLSYHLLPTNLQHQGDIMLWFTRPR